MGANFSGIAWVIGLPLVGFLIQSLLGKTILRALGERFGKVLMGVLAVSPIAAAFAIAAEITFRLGALPATERAGVVTLFDWITLQSVSIPFELRVDTLSMTMVLIITGVGTLIHIYATAYMADDKDFTRFFTYMNLFIAFMLVLVLGNNLPLLFIGWEGVGLCSYLLIGFWYTNLDNSRAANKAFIVNRIGDLGLILGMFTILVIFAGQKEALGVTDNRWLSFDVLIPNLKAAFAGQEGWATFAALMLFIGAMGKSAQFPLYIWLPDAMAGPTPVSALIHAATMVTSGVYLLNRMSELFLLSPVAMGVVSLVGAITALLGALIAFGQTDIKKVLAYSTVSQLGYMFIGCGVGAFYAGLFHVLTHAFFKALLFMGAGAVIHAMMHDQDMRNYGNLRKYMPVTYLVMGVAFLAIAGVPFLFAGFWSKEAILGPAVNALTADFFGVPMGAIAGWIGFFVAFLTAMYMTRMMALTFGTEEERWRLLPNPHHDHHHEHHDHHDHHDHHEHHDHGPDPHGFFMNDAEAEKFAEENPEEHHHALEPTHKPREVTPVMWAPLVVLAVLSLGWIGSLLYSNENFKHWLGYGLEKAAEHGAEHATKHEYGPIGTGILITLSTLTSLGGIAAGIALYRRRLPASEGFDLAKWNPLRKAAGEQFGIDRAFVEGTLALGNALGAFSWKVIDAGLIDGIVNGLGKVTRWFGDGFKQAQTGFVRSYALLMSFGVVLILVMMWMMISRLGVGE